MHGFELTRVQKHECEATIANIIKQWHVGGDEYYGRDTIHKLVGAESYITHRGPRLINSQIL